MNKIFTLGLSLALAAAPCLAQEEEVNETFQFTYADGTVVPNGSTVTVKNYEGNPFGKLEMKSGLYVKNTSDDAASLSIQMTIESLPNGNIQLCFPSACANYSEVGTFETQQGAKKADGTQHDLQTEWFPTSYGTAKATYTIRNYDYHQIGPVGGSYSFTGNGPTVTVIYEYSENSISGIHDVKGGTEAKAEYFDLQGRKADAPAHGLYLVKKGNETQKVLVK